ncbi:MAG: hypothetical protein IPJ65_27790 [Archangiaceae bacterium]|nr:hypothetical protein [Archangiaceae bacterium]
MHGEALGDSGAVGDRLGHRAGAQRLVQLEVGAALNAGQLVNGVVHRFELVGRLGLENRPIFFEPPVGPRVANFGRQVRHRAGDAPAEAVDVVARPLRHGVRRHVEQRAVPHLVGRVVGLLAGLAATGRRRVQPLHRVANVDGAAGHVEHAELQAGEVERVVALGDVGHLRFDAGHRHVVRDDRPIEHRGRVEGAGGGHRLGVRGGVGDVVQVCLA